MKSEFLDQLEALANRYGVDRERVLQMIEEALVSAAKHDVPKSRQMTAHIDRKTGEITCKVRLIAVNVIQNPEDEILIPEVKEKYPDWDGEPGDEVDWYIKPTNFGRIAAQSSKQFIIQHLRQEVKNNICELFKDQVGQLVTGTVMRIDRDGVVVDLGEMRRDNNLLTTQQRTVEGVLPREGKIPGENHEIGDSITALLLAVNADKPGPARILTRSTPEFVRCLFEREVTEIADGVVQIKAVAREAGFRSKIAVTSNEPRVDPVGACVGQHGGRVRNIVREMGGEKVDVLEWSTDVATFVTNALKPAKLLRIKVLADAEPKTVKVTVAEDQYSIAIGKKGQNARLADHLTGWKIDIEKEEPQAAPEIQNMESMMARAIETIGAVEGIGKEAADVLVRHGYSSLEGIVEAEAEDLAALEGIGPERAVAIIAAAKGAVGQ